jgi:hypothetical protein
VNLTLYMDHNVRREITDGLRRRGVDVLTAHEDGADRLSDPELLDRATTLGRVLFSRDEDLIREAIRRQQAGEFFAGVIYAQPTPRLHRPVCQGTGTDHPTRGPQGLRESAATLAALAVA